MTDDLIRRQDAIMVVKDQRLEAIGCIPESYNAGVDASASVLQMIPSAQRTGKWIHYKDEHTCSKCGETVTGDWNEENYYDYCPHCGARMDEE